MSEQTLVILKPDAVQKSLIGEILKRFEKANLKIKNLVMLKLKKKFMGKFYSHLKPKLRKKHFNRIISWMCSDKVLVVVLEGKNAIVKVRGLCGPTDPQKASKHQIRSLSNDSLQISIKQQRGVKNLIHASGSVKEAKQEINMFKKYFLCC